MACQRTIMWGCVASFIGLLWALAHVIADEESTVLRSGDAIPSTIHDVGDTNAEDCLTQGSVENQGISSVAIGSRNFQVDQEEQEEFKHPPRDTQLLVGIKSAVIRGFASRQLIRETWAAHDLLPGRAHVVFLGCEPNWATLETGEVAAWREAIRLEKATYKDLLTHEIECSDSYFLLVEKVKAFFRWTASLNALTDLAFVMTADDDVYVRVDKVMAILFGKHSKVPRSRFYGGQVVESQLRTPLLMNRNESDKDFVAYDVFPLQHKPAFATGAHYVLSVDLVQFLARNDQFLRGVGTLEDVSVAFWLLSLLQIRPTYLVEFDNVRYVLCHNDMLAYGDITGAAMRRMAANLRGSRSFCDSFSFAEAVKADSTTKLPRVEWTGSSTEALPLVYDWEVQWNTAIRSLQILTKVSSPGLNASTSFNFVPAYVLFKSVCEELFTKIVTELPEARVASEFCYDFHSKVLEFLKERVTNAPATSHLFALGISNIQSVSGSGTLVVVRLLRHAIYWRPLIECLLAQSFPGVFVLVELSESTGSSKPYRAPDIIFATADDVDDPTEWEENQFAHWTRIVVLSDRTSLLPSPPRWVHSTLGIFAVTSVREETDFASRHIFLPSESLSFMYRMAHSPQALLKASLGMDERRLNAAAYFGGSNKDQCDQQSPYTVADLIEQLRIRGVTVIDELHSQHAGESSIFSLDVTMEEYSHYKYAIVYDDPMEVSVAAAHEMVSAFLAGSIPIYYGHSATASWLFNPRAFIDCRSFVSMEACALEVSRVDGSVELYASMRGEAAVVNVTAFWEVFSWHPDALSVGGEAGDKATMGERFRHLLLRV